MASLSPEELAQVMQREIARQELEVGIQQGLEQLFLDIDAITETGGTEAEGDQEHFSFSFSGGKVVVRAK